MPFNYFSEAYNFKQKWRIPEQERGTKIFTVGIRQNLPPATILKNLRQAGLGYRTKDFYKDITRAYATEQAHNEANRRRAEKWYELRESRFEQGDFKSRKQATRFLQSWKRGTIQNEQERETALNLGIEERYPRR